MRCPSCGTVAVRRARFCDQCGSRLDATPAIEVGDRRIVSTLFADLVGYTRLVSELDPEDVRACVDAALHELATQVERFGGSLEKFIGDAVFAVFGAPIAHDDDPMRAALCALSMRSALRGIPGANGGDRLALRIGIATGEVVAGIREVGSQRSLSLVGNAVTTAARLQQLAEADEILVDDATMAATRGRVTVEPLAERILRGASRPVAVYRMIAERALPSGRPTMGPMVGRDEEREHLRGLLRETAESATGHVRIVVGEPGMGKSRLLADLERDARAMGFAWTWAQCVSYGAGQPYRLVRKIVESLAAEEGIDAGSVVRRLLFTPDLDPALAEAYAGAIAKLARDASVEGWEAEFPFPPSDPHETGRLLRDVVARFAARLGEEGPRVVVVDDMHWIDPSSLALVDAFARSCAGGPLILLVGTRPGGEPEWDALPHVKTIELHGLTPEATGRLIASVAGVDPAPETTRLLHERSEGNPLFVVEIVRAMLDADVLAARNGRLVVSDPRRVDLLPLSLRALLGARIDALPASPRAVLGVASVVGMRFSEAAVTDVLVPPPHHADFERLAADGLIDAAEQPGTWRFAHPLFHDAAYVGLLAARRRALHARLADRLEREGQVEVARLALHWAAAGDSGRAVPLLERAAAEAVAVGAAVEAAGFLRRAGELADRGDAMTYASRAEEILREATAAPG